jgi:hypothetical protein
MEYIIYTKDGVQYTPTNLKQEDYKKVVKNIFVNGKDFYPRQGQILKVIQGSFSGKIIIFQSLHFEFEYGPNHLWPVLKYLCLMEMNNRYLEVIINPKAVRFI